LLTKLKEVKEILMGFIEDILSMGKERDMEHSNGIMEKNFKEIGRME
jgi:hypothetical protein